ncbi:MAG: glycosyltransferase family 4 protein [Geminicoccaceae bacterium]
MSDTTLTLAVPGGFDRLTGGTIYDRRLAEGLEGLGWTVHRLALPDGYPFPDTAALAVTRERLLALPEGSRLVVDGLALGVLPALAAELAARLELIALVHHPLALETGLDRETAATLRASERQALAHAARVICTSRTTRLALVEDYAVPEARLAVAPPGTDPRPTARGSGGPGLHILNVGSVIPRKDQRTLVAALARLPGRPIRATIAGSLERDAATARALRGLIDETGQAERIALAGELDAEALGGMLAGADLFVSTALHEGYGMALSEALAAGIPALVARGGAVVEAVPESAALFFEPGDVAALGRLIEALCDDAIALDRLREGARRASERLPGWADTARLVAEALRREPGP